MLNAKVVLTPAMIGALASLSACSTEQVVDNTVVGKTGFVAKTRLKALLARGRIGRPKGSQKVSAPN